MICNSCEWQFIVRRRHILSSNDLCQGVKVGLRKTHLWDRSFRRHDIIISKDLCADDDRSCVFAQEGNFFAQSLSVLLSDPRVE